MAPEVHASQPYGFGCDVWAIGVTLWEAATNQRPFTPHSLNDFSLQRHSPPHLVRLLALQAMQAPRRFMLPTRFKPAANIYGFVCPPLQLSIEPGWAGDCVSTCKRLLLRFDNLEGQLCQSLDHEGYDLGSWKHIAKSCLIYVLSRSQCHD